MQMLPLPPTQCRDFGFRIVFKLKIDQKSPKNQSKIDKKIASKTPPRCRKTPPRRPKMPPGCLKTPPRRPKTPPRRLKTPQDASKTAQDAAKTPTRRPKTPPRRDVGGFLVQKWSKLNTRIASRSDLMLKQPES